MGPRRRRLRWQCDPRIQDGVWVRFDNGTDTWDPDREVEDGIWYDVEPPVETAMRVSLYPGGTVSTIGRVPHRVTWLDGDNVGTKSYDVEDRLDGGATWNPVASGVPLSGVLASIAAAHVHQLRAHGVDYAGNVSDWLVGPSVGVTGVQEGSSRIDYSGGWKRVTGTTFWGGASKVTTTAGSWAQVTVIGHSIGLVARRGPSRGVVAVYVNGVKVDMGDLGAATLSPRRIVGAKTYATAAKRTVKIKVLSVPHRTRVELDAFVYDS